MSKVLQFTLQTFPNPIFRYFTYTSFQQQKHSSEKLPQLSINKTFPHSEIIFIIHVEYTQIKSNIFTKTFFFVFPPTDLSDVLSSTFPVDTLSEQFRYEASPSTQSQNDELTVTKKNHFTN